MKTPVYKTKDDLFNLSHSRYMETDSNIMFIQDDQKFAYYKKLYLLLPNASDVLEIYVDVKQYLIIKNYLEHSVSRYMKEFEGYVFYSIKDYMESLEYAYNHKLF